MIDANGASEEADVAADEPPPADSDWFGTRSRRGVLGVLASLGLLGTASQSASAAATTLEFGGKYTSDPGSNYGLWLDPDNARFGLLGFSAASDGRGVVGRATSSSGQTIGVIGRSDSSSNGAAGIQGFNNASSGRTYGFKGRSDSTEGRGALGIATADSGNTIGLEGRADSPDGVAVSGTNTASSGTTVGVWGQVNSPDGYGLATPDDAKVGGKLEFSRGGAMSDTAVRFEVDGEQVVHLDFSEDEVNVINGYVGNEVGTNTQGAVISGGGSRDVGNSQVSAPNSVYGDFAVIGGGRFNEIGANGDDPQNNRHSTIGGGYKNVASGVEATVSGGTKNEAVSGGTVGGGQNNTASGNGATVPGGASCQATGDYSLAVGRAATASHDGALVLGDSTFTEIDSAGTDEVRSQSPVYAPSFNSTSSRAKKTNLAPVDSNSILDGVASLEVRSWEFTDTDDGRHVGPMAEDFHEQFDFGSNDGAIASVDADGVALAAIQELARRQDDRSDRLERLERRVEAKNDRIADLEAETETLHEENEALRERLGTLEEQVAGIEDDRS